MRTKHTTTADLPGEVAQAFNLAGQVTADGWRDQNDRDQLAYDRQAAAARQGDMFPDAEGFRPPPANCPEWHGESQQARSRRAAAHLRDSDSGL